MSRQLRFYITPRHITVVFVALCSAGIIGYFSWLLLPVFRSPRLLLLEPARDGIVSTPELTLKGTLQDGARLTVNHEEVYVDADGNFRQPMFLASGLNIIEFTAEGRFGRKAKLTRYIIVKNPNDKIQMTNQ